MCLNHPETIPSTSGQWKNYLPQKSLPGAKKVGDCCCKELSMLLKYISFLLKLGRRDFYYLKLRTMLDYVEYQQNTYLKRKTNFKYPLALKKTKNLMFSLTPSHLHTVTSH